MKNKIPKIILYFSFLLFSFSILAQEQLPPCGTTEMVEQSLLQNPHLQENLKRLDIFTKHFEHQHSTQNEDTLIIPVVIHVIHNYGSENISFAQVEDAMRILNEDFNKLNSDTNLIIPQFAPIAGNAKIIFRLAKKDPQGNCTQGVTRTVSELTNDANENVKALISWDTQKYLNVWVVRNISFGAGGYAYYPGTAPSQQNEGIVVLASQFGSIGASFGGNFAARTFTHEVGHYLNLRHTWGDSNNSGVSTNCSIDDGVQDTPNTIGVSGQGCPLTQNTCGSLDNVQNYMDYSNCGRMLTAGQVTRMRAALNSTVGGRVFLWQPANLIATGTNNGYAAPLCKPVADFFPKEQSVCQGNTVQFRATPLNVEGDTTLQYEWKIIGQNQFYDTISPLLDFDSSGFFTVQLKVSNAAGADSTTANITVIRTDDPLNAPFIEGIESNVFPANNNNNNWNWNIESTSFTTWERITTTSFEGNASLRLRNQQVPFNSVHTLTSPSLRLNQVPGAVQMRFHYAYAQRNSNNDDALRVMVSSNCGNSWITVFNRSGGSLATVPPQNSVFVPTLQDWKEQIIQLTPYKNAASVFVKFEAQSRAGNYLYLDNIRFGNNLTLSLEGEQQQNATQLMISPNPARIDNALISVFVAERENVNVMIMTATGKIVAQINSTLEAGTHHYPLSENISSLAAGVYLIRLQTEKQLITKKLVIE
jgi:hypothetical protein